jgi:hypothetical protein
MIIGKAISPFALRKKNGGGGGGNDPDAQLFITATGITGTNATATNQLVLDLKSANIWTKMKCIYPFVGNTSASQKYNLKDARDLDIAFRLAFIGGGTFSANGYSPGGVNGYANTFFTPSVNSSGINNFHNSYYSRTDVNLAQVESGCGPSDLQGILLEIRTANLTYIRVNAATTSSYADTNSLGLYTQSRLLGTQQKGYKNGILKITGAVNSNAAPAQIFIIGAYNSNGVAAYYSSKQCAFASIGDGLTDAEALALYNAVQTFNTTLSRNV